MSISEQQKEYLRTLTDIISTFDSEKFSAIISQTPLKIHLWALSVRSSKFHGPILFFILVVCSKLFLLVWEPVSEMDYFDLINQHREQGDTCLHYACKLHKTHIVIQFLNTIQITRIRSKLLQLRNRSGTTLATILITTKKLTQNFPP